MFCGYYENIKTYRFMCLETITIINNHDVTFMENNNVSNNLEMHPSGRDVELTLVVDKSSKSFNKYDGEKKTLIIMT
jgi:hypothetical protein